MALFRTPVFKFLEAHYCWGGGARGAGGPCTLNRMQHDGNNVAHCISCSCNGETSVRKLMLLMHDEEDEDADGGGTATQYNKYSHYNITTWQTTPYHRLARRRQILDMLSLLLGNLVALQRSLKFADSKGKSEKKR